MILCNNNLLHEINGKIERMSQANERKKKRKPVCNERFLSAANGKNHPKWLKCSQGIPKE